MYKSGLRLIVVGFAIAAMFFASTAFGQSNTPVVGKGWMSFTVANGAVLHLGGASQTTPTASLSVSSLLASGIPQNENKTAFASTHKIKHADVIVTSAATLGQVRCMTNGSTPTATAGYPVEGSGNGLGIRNSQQEIFNTKCFNNTGGNITIEVYVWE